MTLEQSTKMYLTMAHLGGLATISVILVFAFHLPDFVKGLSMVLMVVPLCVMLVGRFRDEYIETLWQSGTSLAFAAMVFGFLFLPALEGFYDGLTGNQGEVRDITADTAVFSAILAFYIGFHYHWLRGLR